MRTSTASLRITRWFDSPVPLREELRASEPGGHR
jgi:hypothetical protein